ncbi:methyltransferase RsmF C-terminal domain-like protein [Neorhodopirellula lusitana]|uniref:methyltransferase RsmF C-terminal domain-like protein n=1 Tax=Neorhodopirellula lusitana TaxID=445327 RepID=UPI00384DD569
MSRSRKRRPTSRRPKSSSQSPAVSPEAVAASLQSEVCGNIELPSEELSELTDAIVQRHENALRYHRDGSGPAFTNDPVPWYPRAVWARVAASDDALPSDLGVSDSVAGAPGANDLGARESGISDSVSEPIIQAPLRPSRTLEYAAGEFYLQDAGSLLALAAASAHDDQLRGKLICDLCAAPGGKSSALLEAVAEPAVNVDSDAGNEPSRRGFVLANEPIASRVAPLAYNMARTGCDQYAITSLDPEKLAERLPGVFDMVLVDAPCSGQALMARGKQSATAVQQSQIALNAARQKRILLAASRLLRPGGRLIYSTCTFAIAENEEQVRWMVDDLGFVASPVAGLAEYVSSIEPASYRLWPHRHRCAGSFAASLMLPRPDADPEQNRRHDLWVRQRNTSTPPDDALEQLPFLFESTDHWYQQRDWIVDAFPLDAPDWTSESYVLGPEVAYRTGSTWKPSHAAALRRGGDADVSELPRVELDEESARSYLTGQAIPEPQRGWQIACQAGRPLGWLKGDGRVGKNHLPVHARQPG